SYHTATIWDFLKDYRVRAKGFRPYLIAVVNGHLRSDKYVNLFGSHRAAEGIAAITLRGHQNYADSYRPFLCYYLIRYALSFVCPDLKSHQDTRDCFFDFKAAKRDLEKSLNSGNFCSCCRSTLNASFNPDVKAAIEKMIAAMKAQHATSKAAWHAGS